MLILFTNIGLREYTMTSYASEGPRTVWLHPNANPLSTGMCVFECWGQHWDLESQASYSIMGSKGLMHTVSNAVW